MLATQDIVKRVLVLSLVPFVIFLLPTFFYVIIVLSLGKIIDMFSRVCYFRYKTHCNS